MQDFLTEKELAEKSKLSVQTLRNYRAERKIFPYVKVGRSVRYPTDAVERVLRERTIDAED
jgi:predicted site-specific integrase-resolvase